MESVPNSVEMNADPVQMENNDHKEEKNDHKEAANRVKEWLETSMKWFRFCVKLPILLVAVSTVAVKEVIVMVPRMVPVTVNVAVHVMVQDPVMTWKDHPDQKAQAQVWVEINHKEIAKVKDPKDRDPKAKDHKDKSLQKRNQPEKKLEKKPKKDQQSHLVKLKLNC